MIDLIKKKVADFNEGVVGTEMMSRLDRIPTRLNEFGYDPFGFRPEILRYMISLGFLACKYYWRVQTFGIDNVPSKGRVLLISNHAGQLPWDGFVIGSSILLETKEPRVVRSMVEKFAYTVPFVGNLLSRLGQIIGTPENCIRLLQNEEAILVFPEGVNGISKLFTERYQLRDFGHGFMRLALQTKTPIVPIAVIGSEEQMPSLYNFKSIGKMLGLPAMPITPTFPFLGPLGGLPYPVKYRIYFGEPMLFTGDPDEEESETEKKVLTVRATIQSMIQRGLSERKHVFW